MISKTSDRHISGSPLIEGVTGVILAGGRSSRFGSNKALAEFNGLPLIERAADKLRSLFSKLVIISNSPEEYSYLGFPIYRDIIKGLGPIGGIYTGLDAIENTWGFFTACDMPFINTGLVEYMCERRNDSLDALVPRVDWKIEPLCALYSRRCLPVIKDLISRGVTQTIKAYDGIRVEFIEEKVIRNFDPDLKGFLNINRQDDLEKIRSMEQAL